jgi:hypothetical protein
VNDDFGIRYLGLGHILCWMINYEHIRLGVLEP